MRRLSEALRSELSDALDRRGWNSALPFAEAVALQLAYPLGDTLAAASADAESRAARAIIELLGSASRAPPLRSPAPPRVETTEPLLRDPRLLAAVFQNIDLLYRDRFPHADGVSNLVMQALSTIGESGTGSLPRSSPPTVAGTAPATGPLRVPPTPPDGE